MRVLRRRLGSCAEFIPSLSLQTWYFGVVAAKETVVAFGFVRVALFNEKRE